MPATSSTRCCTRWRLSGLAPGLLTLEITESVMLDHSDRNAAIMRRIRDLGMHISLDDFGSGYSSLTYLRLLPIDSIKIDRSFLQSLGAERPRPRQCCSAIVNLGTAHDLAVVAEGIDHPPNSPLFAPLAAITGRGSSSRNRCLCTRPSSTWTENEKRRRPSRALPSGASTSVAAPGYEHRNDAIRPGLVVGVIGIRGDRPLPPNLVLVAGDLA